MHSGIFPDILKTGIVSPVYKKGNPQLLDNYRPTLHFQFLVNYLKN